MADRCAFFPRQTLTDRERLVWASSYAQHPDDPTFAAEHADALVSDLRRLGLDHRDSLAVEYDLARAGIQLTREEFGSWYCVAWRVRHAAHLQPVPTEVEADMAFARYRGLISDMP